MGDKVDSAARQLAPTTRPTITLPPRPPMDAFFSCGLPGFSPGPMTLVSSLFSDNFPDTEYKSFSQLLAGAMASPGARPPFLPTTSMDNSFNVVGSRDGDEKSSGFKQNRPMNLMIAARSPLFTVPPGLSPSGLLNSPGFFSPQSPFGMSHQQALAQVTAQAALAHSHLQMQAEYQPSLPDASTDSLQRHPSFTPDEASQQQIPPSTSDPPNSVIELPEVSHCDRRSQPSHLTIDKPADDGYNWRKYGQKPIKGCEYPRSYYKCTSLNCSVKKKVERSSDGPITQIIYKGQHNHDKPQSNKRVKDGNDASGNVSSQAKPEAGAQGPAGNLIKSSETPFTSSIPVKGQEPTEVNAIQQLESSDSEEGGDTETREEGVGDDEPNPKRRNIAGESTVALSHKTITEPKIIVQTRSEVDLLDDGYRWRKYGQKVVKGNPHPRSYYKCTSAGCSVRKHVERASTDPKAVITTYEGKHNHDVPAARNSSHNTVSNNVPQLKPQHAVAGKYPLLRDMDFGSKDERPVLLQLKEEKITV